MSRTGLTLLGGGYVCTTTALNFKSDWFSKRRYMKVWNDVPTQEKSKEAYFLLELLSLNAWNFVCMNNIVNPYYSQTLFILILSYQNYPIAPGCIVNIGLGEGRGWWILIPSEG